MLAALVVILPVGLGSAVSPVMLTEQTVLLSASDDRRAPVRYAAGVVLTALIIVSALVFFGRAIALPTEPNLNASLDIVLGLVLLLAAGVVWALGRRPRHSRSHESYGEKAAFPFGVFSMATNVTTIALITPAAKEISAAGVGFLGSAVLVAVLVGLASLPAWLPVLLVRAAPDPGRRVLDTVGRLIDRYGRTMVVVLLGASGLFFVSRGILRVLT
jgi:hypothetical protein